MTVRSEEPALVALSDRTSTQMAILQLSALSSGVGVTMAEGKVWGRGLKTHPHPAEEYAKDRGGAPTTDNAC